MGRKLFNRAKFLNLELFWLWSGLGRWRRRFDEYWFRRDFRRIVGPTRRGLWGVLWDRFKLDRLCVVWMVNNRPHKNVKLGQLALSLASATVFVMIVYAGLFLSDAPHRQLWAGMLGVSLLGLLLFSPNRSVVRGLRLLSPFDWLSSALLAIPPIFVFLQMSQASLVAKALCFICWWTFFLTNALIYQRLRRWRRLRNSGQ